MIGKLILDIRVLWEDDWRFGVETLHNSPFHAVLS